MRGGVLRIGLLVAAVGLGVLLIAGGFSHAGPGFFAGTDGTQTDGNGDTNSPPPDETPDPDPTATGNGNGNNGNGENGNGNGNAQCQRQGVKVAAYNASQTTGLAAAARERLERQGYVFEGETAIGNAPQISPNTIVYYRRAADKGEAQCLADLLIDGAQVTKLPSEATYFPESARLAVLLGADYATENPPV